jgi:S1/P1 Nuclease
MFGDMTKHRSVPIVLSLLAVFILAPAAHAWIDTGHKIIALIVWDELMPAAKAKAIDILKQHPRYDKDLMQGAAEGLSDADAARYAFAMAATWPDMVRSQNDPMHTLYHHPAWHYIDIPYVVGNVPVKPESATNASGPTNIVEALTKNVADLKDAGVGPADKAVALCWVLHLGGDIHQPLHCVQMYSGQFPDGDQGGNAQVVLRDPPYPDSRIKLHLLWDEIPGQYQSIEPIGYLAGGLRSDPKFSRQELKTDLAVTDFMAWAQESHDLAAKYAYLNGNLQTAPAHGASGPIPGLPPGYLAAAEEVAMKRLILAGYRTADLVNSALGSN